MLKKKPERELIKKYRKKIKGESNMQKYKIKKFYAKENDKINVNVCE